MKNFESLINDLKKAAEISKQMKSMTIKTTDPLSEVAKYAVNSRIITSSTDILELSESLPAEIVKVVAKELDSKNKENENNSYRIQDSECYNYRCGSYDRCGIGISNRC